MKTVLIFDQAESPGGSISRVVELAEKLTEFNFIFITFHTLETLRAKTHHHHITSYRIKSFYNDKIAHKHTAWLKKQCSWLPYHALVNVFISALMGLNRKFTLWQALRILRRHPIDLIQANCGLHSLPYLIAKKLKKPIIYYFRDLQNYQALAKERIAIAQKYVFVGENLMNRYKEQLCLPNHKCIMVRSPFDVNERLKNHSTPDLSLINQLRSQGKKVLIMPARITPDKGQMTALEAVHLLHQKLSNFGLIIVGSTSSSTQDNQYLAQLHTFIAEKNLTSHVYFLGHRDDVLHLVKESDIAVHAPIYYEAMAGGIVESLQLGIPTISSDIGGAREAIKDGVSGFLFPPADHIELANILETILLEKYDLKRISENGKKHAVENWNPAQIQTRMLAIYLSILGNGSDNGCN